MTFKPKPVNLSPEEMAHVAAEGLVLRREIEARVAKMSHKTCRGCAELKTENERLERHLGNLLAVIHRDGGHYQAEHGTSVAVTDAMGIVPATVTENERLRALVDDNLTAHAIEQHDILSSEVCDCTWCCEARIALDHKGE